MSTPLHCISDKELLANLHRLAVRERDTVYRIVQYLIELERRRLFAEAGYSSVYDYAVRALGYSAGAAMRRIRAARLVARIPEAGPLLAAGELGLGSMAVLDDVLTEYNAAQVLSAARGKSQEEGERIAVRFGRRLRQPAVEEIRPVGLTQDGISCQPELPVAGKNQLYSAEAESMKSKTARRKTLDEKVLHGPHNLAKCDDDILYQLQFVASGELVRKLHRARELLRGRGHGRVTFEKVLTAALDELLCKHCPQERGKRRRKRAEQQDAVKRRKKQIHDNLRHAGRILGQTHAKQARSRHIPAAVRDEVFERDGHQCSYVSSDGVRCAAQHMLELDHIKPFAKGGENTADNLRLRCRAHNMLAAEQEFGKAHMEQFRAGGGNTVGSGYAAGGGNSAGMEINAVAERGAGEERSTETGKTAEACRGTISGREVSFPRNSKRNREIAQFFSERIPELQDLTGGPFRVRRVS